MGHWRRIARASTQSTKDILRVIDKGASHRLRNVGEQEQLNSDSRATSSGVSKRPNGMLATASASQPSPLPSVTPGVVTLPTKEHE